MCHDSHGLWTLLEIYMVRSEREIIGFANILQTLAYGVCPRLWSIYVSISALAPYSYPLLQPASFFPLILLATQLINVIFCVWTIP